ncbi:hypothetical protein WS50_09780 [Burkholderia territorii]|nr:hypothetical protein WS47_23745 [Burkholderia territorii]KUZ19517.1 hypothetical protein WS50_09780 [Burkholderia territorii]
MQHRDIIGYELGLSHRQYVGSAVIDGSFAWRASLPGLSGNSGTVVGAPGFDGKMEVELASLNARITSRFCWKRPSRFRRQASVVDRSRVRHTACRS